MSYSTASVNRMTYSLSATKPTTISVAICFQICIFAGQFKKTTLIMADNYLERRREDYEARKAAWLKNKKRTRTSVTENKWTTDGNEMLHSFSVSIEDLELPKKFTNPFDYDPHPLCILATEEVQRYLSEQTEWKEELDKGKMFGVLVVRTREGELGFLAAFSGLLNGTNRLPYFVPPVYDLLQPGSFFKQEEKNISGINARVRALEMDENYLHAQTEVKTLQQEAEEALTRMHEDMKVAKAHRQALRLAGGLTPDEEATLVHESQFQKAEYKRAQRQWETRLSNARSIQLSYAEEIEKLKTERKHRSAALQMRLFWHYRMLNARGERKDLCEIFANTPQRTPPAGAGECAAPKLLQQAYLHKWKPLCMAEFWWGRSPKNEIRHHGHYYPACRSKCGPILSYMLQGIEVEEAHATIRSRQASGLELPVLYEDAWIAVVNKPAGMLSVPGREKEADSVLSRIKECLPEADGPLVVHRLDMDTSGLMLIAKSKEVHRKLQALFETRAVEKRYIALLDGSVAIDQGEIDLPLAPAPHDRPRQEVNYSQGKKAVTRYEVLERKNGLTRIAFHPLTGRTHQLRVHAAHPDGLGCPIVGDRLYGKKKAERLYLHAERLELTHPVTGQALQFSAPCPF